MYGKVFVSYRREGGAEFARLVRDALQRRGYEVFLDIEDLRSGPFNAALLHEIEAASDVVVVLTPGSLERCRQQEDWLRLEVAHALKCRKNVVPVMTRGFEWPAWALPQELAELPNQNGIIPSHDYFEASMDKLAALLTPQRQRLSRRRTLVGVVVALLLGIAVLAILQTTGRDVTRKAVNGNGRPSVAYGNKMADESETVLRPRAEVTAGAASAPPTGKPTDTAQTAVKSETTAPTHRGPTLLLEEWTGNTRSALTAYAFSRDRVVVKSAGANTFRHKPGMDLDGVIVTTLFEFDVRECLQDLHGFVNEGGRAVVLVSADYGKFNGDLQELFGVSIVRQAVVWLNGSAETEGQRPVVSGEEYCPLFDGLSIAGGAVRPILLVGGKPLTWDSPGISCCLMPAGDGWVTSQSKGRPESHLSAWRAIGKGQILFLVSFETAGFPEPFFDDGRINAADNIEAALRLVQWLSGKRGYPGSG